MLRALEDQFSRGHANYWQVQPVRIPKSVTGYRENGSIGNNFWIRSDAATEEQTMKNAENSS